MASHAASLMEQKSEGISQVKFKWILILEIFFAGIYLALTRGLFVVFLVSMGFGLERISLIILISATIVTLSSLLVYAKPSFLVKRVKLKLVFFHGLERIMWVFIPLTQDYVVISLLYAVTMCLPVSTFMNLVIYGSLSEDGIKDVTAKRSAAFGVSSVVGFTLAVILVAFMPAGAKYFYIYLLGALVGIVSTLVVALLSLSHLEGMKIPTGIEQPERVFSTSSFFVALLSSGNLLGIVWIPYVMNHLGGSDSLAASMNLAGTMASVAAALLWRGRTFGTLRSSLGLDALVPFLAWSTLLPGLHVPLFAYSSFTYTGASFVGHFLFARYNRWLGAIKSSVLMVTVGSLAQLVVAPVGIIVKEDYALAFLIIILIKVVSIILALITIPEVAIVPEDTARTYSLVLYSNSVMGYRVAVEVSRDTILTTLRLLALSLVLLTLYVIYRVLMLMML